ncbi:hypothetical protein ONA22_01755 [Mycoplasmopsis cynos]|uniref:hypothetical protein n=1 Tax=Mycoplasmopsis cynos TaxID=171284 RepID=UPI0024C732E3|nr:hypothetical protein [Mycoplasmopsis cynos]WAM03748.1 hypothetical protein ONA22_01755 [Mycoplasmopsis cynos]
MTIYFYFAEPSATYGIDKLINGEFINPRYDLAAAFRFGFFHTISVLIMLVLISFLEIL